MRRHGRAMTATTAPPNGAFRHEAFLYAGAEEFLEGTLDFVREGLTAGEPVLVLVDADKIRRMRAELNGDGSDAGVLFADMAEVGRNPARIIPAWRDFLDEHGAGGRRVRGIGEPIWAGRRPAELVECQRHESLLNLAFAGTPAWWLMCPYDTTTLPPPVIDEALASHPFIVEGRASRRSARYRGVDTAPFAVPLPEPPGGAVELSFELGDLREVRAFVARYAARIRLGRDVTDDLVFAVNEIATNSLCHAGGRGTLRMWCDGDSVVCEVTDDGTIDQPLAGRDRPAVDQEGGRGLWLANQLCDLVQVRSFPSGNVVRLQVPSGMDLIGRK